MKFLVLDTFRSDYRRLPRDVRRRMDKALQLFEKNPRHPSVRAKRIQGTADIWEGRVTRGYRFTFNWEDDLVTLRRVGTHDLLKKEKW